MSTQTREEVEARMRDRMLRESLQDPSSAVYAALTGLLRGASADEELARARDKEVVIPFQVPEADVRALSEQFSVGLKVRGSQPRSRLTPRVAALVYIVEAALLEHASGGGRRVLALDADLVGALYRNGNEIVEHTSATSRLAVSYFQEVDVLRGLSRKVTTESGPRASVVLSEVQNGGGEHYWPRVRVDGPAVDAVAVNHFRTPACLAQLVALASARGGVLYGVMPFQLDFLVNETGALRCFPGRYVVDRTTDTVSLVPSEDPSMSISHPYSALCALAKLNSVVVSGEEWTCEKYMSHPGVLYYVLRKVGREYEAPEVLRSFYFNAAKAGVTVVEFPEVEYSPMGVATGFKRSSLGIWTERFERVMYRLTISTSALITPAEAFTALAGENSVVINTLDTAVAAERMPVEDEMRLAVALALYANWRRHATRGTLNVLLAGVKERCMVRDADVSKLLYLSLSSWWQRMVSREGITVSGSYDQELPVDKVVDSCGTDFSVLVRDSDPWVSISQEVGFLSVKREKHLREGAMHPVIVRWDGSESQEWYDGTEGWVDWMKRPVGSIRPVGRALVDSLLSVVRGRQTVAVGSALRTKVEEGAGLVEAMATSVVRPTARVGLSLAVGVKTQLKGVFFREFLPGLDKAPDSEQIIYEAGDRAKVGPASVPEVDPYSAISSDLMDLLGGPPERDMLATGHRLCEVDVERNIEGSVSVNEMKRVIPQPVFMRRPKVDLGVEGARVQSQMALVGAVLKRNVGVPDNRGAVDIQKYPDQVVQRVVDVCYRSDWKEIVTRHLETGLWEANEGDIDGFLANADEAKVKRMLKEDAFFESEVNLTRWMLMAKGKVKPSREPDVDYRVDHSQTILFLENSKVNAFYSSMVRRFKDVIDECLLPEISLNAQHSDEEHEKWYNSLEPRRRSVAQTYAYSTDIRCYDRAQDQVPLRVDIAWYRLHGLNSERLAIWEQTHGTKKAISMMWSLILWMTLGGVSGIFKTLLRNGVLNLAAVVESAGIVRGDIVVMDIKGDDMDLETFRPIDVEKTIEGMAVNFNFSAKMFTSQVRYMCKTFRIYHQGWWYFVPDMWARAQSILTPARMANHEDGLALRWQSMSAELRHYQNMVILDLACEAAQQMYGFSRPPTGLAYSLSLFARDKVSFLNFFLAPERVS